MEAGELAFGIEDDLLHLAGGLLEQSTQRAALALAGVGLNQEASFEETGEVDRDLTAVVDETS